MWRVKGTPVTATWLSLEPLRVLYDFDGPKIFTCRAAAGQLFLAFQCDEDEGARRFLVVPFSDDLESHLTTGAIDVRDALTRAPAWLFDLGNDRSPLRCWEVAIEDLPPDVLPEPGVMLWADLPPVVNGATARGSAIPGTSASRTP